MLRLLLLAAVVLGQAPVTQSPGRVVRTQDDSRRTIAVTARAGGFDPPQIDVRQNDLVQVTFTAADVPHAFTIDTYRIAKRATPGHPSLVEFRADQVGRFPFYCTLAAPNGQTHSERGELVVRK
jgi:heme/copper-type cytochrome/quinol oxidase subunit 2